MKKAFLTLLCVLAATVLFSPAARADLGPKPSVVVDFAGLDGETCYATLLSSVRSTGPYSAAADASQVPERYRNDDADQKVFLKFAQYKDADGYFFLQIFQDCTRTHRFSWTYYPPQKFKILLYFPQTDRFAVSDASYERYAFDSYFTAKVSGQGGLAAARGAVVTAKKSYDTAKELIFLLIRTALTVVIELAVALPFGFREKRQLRFIVLVNVATQLALNLALNFVNNRFRHLSLWVSYALLELLVFAAEAALYTFYLKKHSRRPVPGWKPGIYALTANAASFAFGIVLTFFTPGIF